ncbi:OadG family protein [Saccharospirillum impatiens]|uniref:OadG family protein n=1 Tax=Saccharospirillum impatiens TaxID=169438 RepID=UPI000423313E|nr:OadG family protein [Saccharospirillum impatiens]
MSEFLREGFSLLFMGMGTVFVFLTVLVIGTTLMSKIINRFFGLPEPEAKGKRRPSTAEDLSELAAVAAAVKAVHGH